MLVSAWRKSITTDVPSIVAAMTGSCGLKCGYFRREESFFFVDTHTPLWGKTAGRETPAAESSFRTEARGCGISLTAGDLPS